MKFSNIDSDSLLNQSQRRQRYLPLDLRRYFNNDGISFDDLKCDGNFDGNGATFPAEELPSSNTLIHIDGIPFHFPSKERGEANNIALAGQTIGFAPSRVKAIHALGAVEGQNGEVYEEEITVSLMNGEFAPVYLGFSNWLLTPQYNEKMVFECGHLHSPDAGQVPQGNLNSIDQSPINEPNPPIELISKTCDIATINKQNSLGDWRPRLWMQKVSLNFVEQAIGLTFGDNLNFHIFAITLEIGAER